jgi:hypothetical protein
MGDRGNPLTGGLDQFSQVREERCLINDGRLVCPGGVAEAFTPFGLWRGGLGFHVAAPLFARFAGVFAACSASTRCSRMSSARSSSSEGKTSLYFVAKSYSFP